MSSDEEAERRLGPIRTRRDHHQTAARQASNDLAAAVAACLKDGLPPASIARGAGLSRQTIYEIRRTTGAGQ